MNLVKVLRDTLNKVCQEDGPVFKRKLDFAVVSVPDLGAKSFLFLMDSGTNSISLFTSLLSPPCSGVTFASLWTHIANISPQKLCIVED